MNDFRLVFMTKPSTIYTKTLTHYFQGMGWMVEIRSPRFIKLSSKKTFGICNTHLKIFRASDIHEQSYIKADTLTYKHANAHSRFHPNEERDTSRLADGDSKGVGWTEQETRICFILISRRVWFV